MQKEALPPPRRRAIRHPSPRRKRERKGARGRRCSSRTGRTPFGPSRPPSARETVFRGRFRRKMIIEKPAPGRKRRGETAPSASPQVGRACGFESPTGSRADDHFPSKYATNGGFRALPRCRQAPRGVAGRPSPASATFHVGTCRIGAATHRGPGWLSAVLRDKERVRTNVSRETSCIGRSRRGKQTFGARMRAHEPRGIRAANGTQAQAAQRSLRMAKKAVRLFPAWL